jgi:polar amino acid transport system substrate-binding protein
VSAPLGRRAVLGVAAFFAAGGITTMHAAEPNPLVTDGKLRVGLVRAPTAGLFFVAVGADGVPHGVTADLGTAMAAALGVPVAFSIFPNSGECTDAVAGDKVDVAFMPVDPARSARVLFGPAYYDLESTYLVSAASGITTLAEVDRPGVRVVGIADTTTIRASARTLHMTKPVAIRGVEEAIAAIRDGRADALALSRDSLAQIAPTIPGSRIVPGGFQQTTVSLAVPPGHTAALAEASALLARLKRDGTVQRAFAAVGLGGEKVAG